MAISLQFKSVVAAVYDAPQVRRLESGERAIAAVEIARTNLVRSGYLTQSSMHRPLIEMQETTRGKQASRAKRNDSTRSAKLRKFESIWVEYAQAIAEQESSAPRAV